MQKHITYILNTFNFERVHIAMTALDWTWVDGGNHVIPSITKLKQTAKRLLEAAATEKITTGSGGFQAKYCPPEKDPVSGTEEEEMLVLSFVLTETDSEYYDWI